MEQTTFPKRQTWLSFTLLFHRGSCSSCCLKRPFQTTSAAHSPLPHKHLNGHYERRGEVGSWPGKNEVSYSACVLFFPVTLGQREPSPAPRGRGRQINAEALIFQMKTYYCSFTLSLSLSLAQGSGAGFVFLSPALFLPLRLGGRMCFLLRGVDSPRPTLLGRPVVTASGRSARDKSA